MGDVATVAQIAGLDSLKLITAIVQAAKNARMHRKNCRNFAQHLRLIGNLLEQLKLQELKEHAETSEPLERLEEALRKAYLLVNSCKNKSYFYVLAMGWSLVNQFKVRQTEIDRLLHLIPLINLVENRRVQKHLEVIQNDQKDYKMDEQEAKLQETLLKNERSPTESMELQKSLSRSYPGLSLEEALKKENKKLRKELEQMQSLMEPDQCNVIRHLIEITETDVKAVQYTTDPEFVKANAEQYSESKSSSFTYEDKPKLPESPSEKSCHAQDWHHDLLECCSDPLLCISAFVCPCCAFSAIAATATDGIMPQHAACTNCIIYSMVLACCFYTCCFRRKLRKRYNIEVARDGDLCFAAELTPPYVLSQGGSCGDCCAHLLCLPCALVQEAREIKFREGNKRSESRKKMVPPSEQSMERD